MKGKRTMAKKNWKIIDVRRFDDGPMNDVIAYLAEQGFDTWEMIADRGQEAYRFDLSQRGRPGAKDKHDDYRLVGLFEIHSEGGQMYVIDTEDTWFDQLTKDDWDQIAELIDNR